MAKSCGIKVLFCLAVLFTGVNCTKMHENDMFGTGICGSRPAYRPSLRIHGGSDAHPGYWPWIGSMQIKHPDGHFCGCTLLSQEWAVTAAHCVVHYRNVINEVTLVFGITNVNTLEPSNHRVERSISGVIINPDSVEVMDIRNNDIALLRLSSPIKFTDYVSPACLATRQDEVDAYTNCWAAGWGGLGKTNEWLSKEEEDEYPDILQQVHLPLISEETCKRDEYRWKPILTEDMICAGDERGKNTCSGDSGGPLVCQDENQVWNLVGIVSWGLSSCNILDPSVFCRVSKFLDFIDTAVTQNEACGLEISLNPEDTASLTSIGYPLHYDNYLYCFWTVIAPVGQRVYANFEDFHLQRVDYVYIGIDRDNPKTLRYTGHQTPPDIVSPENMLYVTFESDSGVNDKGFSLTLSSTSETDFALCKNGIEILPANKICDGTPHCYDRSDERLCPQCEPIPIEVPVVCGELPYRLTYYPDSIADSKEHALNLLAEKYDRLAVCSQDALLLFCNKVFPPCPIDEKKWAPCKHFCEDVSDECSHVFNFGECDALPDEAGGKFCSFKDGDIFGTAVCGTRPALNPRQRIHAGHDAVSGSWPWIGSIHYLSNHICGCTLLNEHWAVTTIDCLMYLDEYIESVNVVFGTVNINTLVSSTHRVEREIAQTILNPDWENILNLSIKRNNIALLRFSQPIEFNEFVRPACLATSLNETREYENCMVAGWGETGDLFSDDISSILQEVNVPLVSSERCRSEFDYGWVVSDDMICTDGGHSKTGHCAGDTGGPLVCQDKSNFWHLVGIVSFGGSCGDIEVPGVYSRISWLLDFITIGITTGSIPCRSDQFRCNDGQCIPSLWSRCNVTTECSDGSDEQGCNYCPANEYRLSSGSSTERLQSVGYPNNYPNDLSCKWTVSPGTSRRIQVKFIDLGLENDDHLYVGTEENLRTIKYTGDTIPQLRVLSAVGEDLVMEFETDGYNSDDTKGFSLLFSAVVDGDYTFCSNGLEILDTGLSGNGIEKCYNGGSGDREISIKVCSSTYEFQCNNGECIPKSHYCDRHSDCMDHTDEIDCYVACYSISDWLFESYFECGSGESIYLYDKCDHTKECLDGSDEKNCMCTRSNEFLCGSGECIYTKQKCDGTEHCDDGSDEVNCKDSSNARTGGIVVGVVLAVTLLAIIPVILRWRLEKRKIPRTRLENETSDTVDPIIQTGPQNAQANQVGRNVQMRPQDVQMQRAAGHNVQMRPHGIQPHQMGGIQMTPPDDQALQVGRNLQVSPPNSSTSKLVQQNADSPERGHVNMGMEPEQPTSSAETAGESTAMPTDIPNRDNIDAKQEEYGRQGQKNIDMENVSENDHKHPEQ